MLYFATRVQCKLCSCKFNVWFQTETPPDADAKYRVECPQQAIPYALPFSAFKLVKRSPMNRGRSKKAELVMEAELVTEDSHNRCRDGLHFLSFLDLPPEPPPKPPKRPWWQFWK